VKRALMVLLIVLLAIHTVKADSADFSFHVSPVKDTFHPGDEAPLILLVQNEAELKNFLVNENTSQAVPMLTTAYDVRVKIEACDVPITVETVNPQLLASIPAGGMMKAVFKIRVWDNASEGTYQIPLKIDFKKYEYTPTPNGMIVNMVDDSYTAYFKIKIEKRDYDFAVHPVLNTIPESGEGVVELKVVNTGRYELRNASAILNVTPPLRINPKAMTAYLGDLKPGESRVVKFKVIALEGAFNGSYPAKLVLSFKTSFDVPMMLYRSFGIRVINERSFGVEELACLVTPSKTLRVSSSEKMSLPLPNLPFLKQKPQQMTMSGVITIPTRGYVKVRITNNGETIRDAYAMLVSPNPLIKAENTPYIGTLRHGESKVLTFYVTCYAPAGSYMGYVLIKYKRFGDELVSPKLYVRIEVSPEPALRVVNVKTFNLAVGMKGEIDLKLAGKGENAELYLLSPDGNVKPLTSSACVVNGTAKFRVEVSGDALPGYHRLYAIERFDCDGAQDLVSVAEFNVYVNPKMAYFQIVSVRSEGLYPDATGTVYVEVRNAGNTPVYNAVVMLYVNTPLSIAGSSGLGSLMGQSQPGTYFIGTLNPGEVKVAKFRIKVDKHAGAGSYPATVRIKYYDSQGYSYTSDSITVSVEVKSSPLLTPLTATALLLAAIGIGIGAYFGRKRRAQ